jgi:1-acyl-sn-glycerol-3-phosphate acyltransferase
MKSQGGYAAYRFAKPFFRAAFRLWNRARCDGLPHVPAEGPLIVAANHASYLDPFVLGAFFPRPLHFMMTRVFYDPWYFRWFCRRMGAIPLDKDAVMDFGAMRQALRLLAAGRAVGIFPEGRRGPGGGLLEFSPGAAALAMKSGALVLPVYLDGTHRSLPMGRSFAKPAAIRIHIGAPLAPGDQTRDGLIQAVHRAVTFLQKNAGG